MSVVPLTPQMACAPIRSRVDDLLQAEEVDGGAVVLVEMSGEATSPTVPPLSPVKQGSKAGAA
ncbi:hypothetical protein J7I94_27640 [Streptomyces sp. ISL-12]|uniref:hypothetical protein n=1 Tax=Streptomyces sp. ISL-12 TaxID=2819177 RepID=UPI001BEBFDA8|nr:hypothetical protein [Streptomyces sp. ISL-12]MBT2414275.1 hypothetical protein [Streptomyces sp. ISL-12]